ncbi:MAG: hypothetical protein Q7T21_01990 [Gallionella sp.]|nr:hypothetical protein [Gallionella sp.]
MKLNKFALTLTVAALLPNFAYAGTDAVVASFERDLQREPVQSAAAIAGEADPLVAAFNVALHGTTDQVLASFERDLNRAPAATDAVMIAGEVDPIAAAFNAVLRGEIVKPVVHAALPGSGS